MPGMSEREEQLMNRIETLQTLLNQERYQHEVERNLVAMALHDLGNSLSSIHMVSNLVTRFRSKLTPRRFDEHLNAIEARTREVTERLRGILASLQAHTAASRTSVDFQAFAEQLVQQAAGWNDNTCAIRYACTGDLDNFLTDEYLLRGIVLNLLTNAVKYSPDGGQILLTVHGSASMVDIRIRDEGIGIPQAEINRIFEPYYRGTNVASINGTGLGLSIVKGSVELLGGTISVERVLPTGTAFTVQLPRRSADQ
jgi:signal transduction histidine kinase